MFVGFSRWADLTIKVVSVFSVMALALSVASPTLAREQSSLGGLHISASRVPDWWHLDELRHVADGWTVVNVGNVGVNVFDNGVDNSSMQAAINNAAPRTVLYIPAGGRLVLNGRIDITRSNIVIRGAGMNQSMITCTGYCIRINNRSPYSNARAWTGGFTKGSTVLTLANTSGLSVGDWVHMSAAFQIPTQQMRQPDFGYAAKIVAVNPGTNRITIDRPVRQDMTGGNQVVERYTPFTNIGVEHLSLVFANAGLSPTWNTPFSIHGLAESWIIGLNFGTGPNGGTWNNNMIGLDDSNRNLIADTTFGTLGRPELYQKAAIQYFGKNYDNVSENNIFVDCPQAYELQRGSAGNVGAYNYFLQPTSAGGCERDTMLHGDGSYDNLFEANDGFCADHWDNLYGSNYKGNTFFRMRKRKSNEAPGEYDGTSGAETMNRNVNTIYSANIIGNSFFKVGGGPQPFRAFDEASDAMWFEGNLYRDQIIVNSDASHPPVLVGNAGTITYRGDSFQPNRATATQMLYNVQGNSTSASWRAERRMPASFYRTTPPAWWCQESGAWPNIGADKDNFNGTLDMLPAERRHRGLSCTTAAGTWIAPPVVR